MNHGTSPPTTADIDRFQQLADLGCIVCLVYGPISKATGKPSYIGQFRPIDVSHLLSGGRRIGHQCTLGECDWHHRGVPVDGLTREECRARLGPNRADEPAQYHALFGTDEELLYMNNKCLEKKAQLKGRPFKPRSKQSEAIIPREWTIYGAYAVKTRGMSIAMKVVEQIEKLADGATGPIDGCDWMPLADFEEKTRMP